MYGSISQSSQLNDTGLLNNGGRQTGYFAANSSIGNFFAQYNHNIQDFNQNAFSSTIPNDTFRIASLNGNNSYSNKTLGYIHIINGGITKNTSIQQSQIVKNSQSILNRA
jgi:hypothetical protein